MLRWLILLPLTLWAAGAILVDGPLTMSGGNRWLAVLWLLPTLALLVMVRQPKRRFTLWLVAWLAVALPWFAIEPSNDRVWRADWAKTGWATVEGNRVTFHNFRNFDYAADGNVTERWERRSVRLSELRAVDYFQSAFGGDLIAHPIISFDFGPDGHIALSIETRREVGESFSEIGGLYKMFELQYIFGDERDLIRLRTNIWNEPVYLYRTRAGRERGLQMLMDSIRTQNALRERPRFYNVLTQNCTTSYRAQTAPDQRMAFDYRMLANGRLDSLLHERDALMTDGKPFAALRKAALINDAAQTAHDDPGFSQRIRNARPGFSN
jgi:hypothetical protein